MSCIYISWNQKPVEDIVGKNLKRFQVSLGQTEQDCWGMRDHQGMQDYRGMWYCQGMRDYQGMRDCQGDVVLPGDAGLTGDARLPGDAVDMKRSWELTPAELLFSPCEDCCLRKCHSHTRRWLETDKCQTPAFVILYPGVGDEVLAAAGSC